MWHCAAVELIVQPQALKCSGGIVDIFPLMHVYIVSGLIMLIPSLSILVCGAVWQWSSLCGSRRNGVAAALSRSSAVCLH